MSEEYGNNFVTLTDEDGVEAEFEHIDTIDHEGATYVAFIPADLQPDEEAEVVILKVTEIDNEEMLEAIENEDELMTVFNIFLEREEAAQDEAAQ
ncbi:MAG: DUF1292 domain-containing protein [Clostridia bacterium]